MNHKHGGLFRFAIKLLTLFLLVLFGLAIACLVAIAYGGLHIVALLMGNVWVWIGRMAVLVMCVLLVAVIQESLR
ncbi:MAG: hypothetical protein NZ772_15540 [Cyanobacteria bacterium]|nr:hypothetical protein [Cyanobacteriota bacterium]MDW8202751.1 hypothetical protein [Cyanobacteriota bacterium SKYGB_h_bin112]